jgi:hypothetical protein
VDHQPDAGRFARVDHLCEIRPEHGRRLLAENVGPMPRGQIHQEAMRFGLGADFHKIDRSVVLEQILRVRVSYGRIHSFGGPRQAIGIKIAKRH